MKKVMSYALVLSMGLPTIAKADSKKMILSAKTIQCGGYISLEKNSDTTLHLGVNLSENSTCNRIKIDSLNMKYSLVNRRSDIALDHNAIGAALPVEINNELVILDLSSTEIAKQISTSHTKEELEQIAQQQEEEQKQQDEIARRQDREQAAAGVAAGTALVVGAGAATAAAAVSDER